MSPEARRHRMRIGRALASGRLPFDYKPEKAMNSGWERPPEYDDPPEPTGEPPRPDGWMKKLESLPHEGGEWADAAAAFAGIAAAQCRGADAGDFTAEMMVAEGEWPWDEDSWWPYPNSVDNLEIAQALLRLELDRLHRKQSV